MQETSSNISIHWFRNDLRLADNPALHAAAEHGPVLAVYVLDDNEAGARALGAASRWWLFRSLKALNASLDGRLAVCRGRPEHVIASMAQNHSAAGVYWNRGYDPTATALEERVRAALERLDVAVHRFDGSLLWEPGTVLKWDGTPYRVFTPFYRHGCLANPPPRQPLPPPRRLRLITAAPTAATVEDLEALPTPALNQRLETQWDAGEPGAQRQLDAFLGAGLRGYHGGRDFPAQRHVSRFSPHLRFGELSPNEIWYAVSAQGDGSDHASFLRQLAWREFSYHLLFHYPALHRENLQRKFDTFPWRSDDEALRRWRRGATGYPIVDAGMRELAQTGYMHNRVRMLTASFLVKNLLIDWREGEAWFWRCLVDADPANNSAGWQWVAGCGADAAPYFRVFNPVTQAKKFDPDGHYIRRFLPELAQVPTPHLFDPGQAPRNILDRAGVVLGGNYPYPIVDLKASRERALNAFAGLAVRRA